MTAEIKDSIKVRNELRKTFQQNRSEWIQACRNTADLITKRKNKTWKEHVESCNKQHGTTKMEDHH